MAFAGAVEAGGNDDEENEPKRSPHLEEGCQNAERGSISCPVISGTDRYRIRVPLYVSIITAKNEAKRRRPIILEHLTQDLVRVKKRHLWRESDLRHREQQGVRRTRGFLAVEPHGAFSGDIMFPAGHDRSCLHRPGNPLTNGTFSA